MQTHDHESGVNDKGPNIPMGASVYIAEGKWAGFVGVVHDKQEATMLRVNVAGAILTVDEKDVKRR